jgi:hypothetical protein
MALAESDLDHHDEAIRELRVDHDNLAKARENDAKSNKTAFYALVGTIVTALSSGTFLLLSLVLK